jgi:parallel beta-helix repeat protein
VTENNIANNGDYGIRLFDSSNSVIHHNTFDNAKQAIIQGSSSKSNSWDNGTEGNYWSDYQTKYPSAKEIADTGVWDTPYVIDDNNKDNYPLLGDAAPAPTSTPTLPPTSSPTPTQMPSGTPTPSPEPPPTSTLPMALIFVVIAVIILTLAGLAVWKLKKRQVPKKKIM